MLRLPRYRFESMFLVVDLPHIDQIQVLFRIDQASGFYIKPTHDRLTNPCLFLDLARAFGYPLLYHRVEKSCLFIGAAHRFFLCDNLIMLYRPLVG